MNAPDIDALEKLAAIVSDAEIARVHGSANFGAMTPRDVVNDGVRKYAVGYTGGHTQLCILLEHRLITKPRPGRYDANLTKKGKAYARALIPFHKALIAEVRSLRVRVARWEPPMTTSTASSSCSAFLARNGSGQ